jgi:hypothetical protein
MEIGNLFRYITIIISKLNIYLQLFIIIISVMSIFPFLGGLGIFIIDL